MLEKHSRNILTSYVHTFAKALSPRNNNLADIGSQELHKHFTQKMINYSNLSTDKHLQISMYTIGDIARIYAVSSLSPIPTPSPILRYISNIVGASCWSETLRLLVFFNRKNLLIKTQ